MVGVLSSHAPWFTDTNRGPERRPWPWSPSAPCTWSCPLRSPLSASSVAPLHRGGDAPDLPPVSHTRRIRHSAESARAFCAGQACHIAGMHARRLGIPHESRKPNKPACGLASFCARLGPCSSLSSTRREVWEKPRWQFTWPCGYTNGGTTSRSSTPTASHPRRAGFNRPSGG